MTTFTLGTCQEWLGARLELLELLGPLGADWILRGVAMRGRAAVKNHRAPGAMSSIAVASV